MAVVVTWTLNRRAPLDSGAKKCRPSATPLKLAEFDSSGADSVQFLFGVAVGNFAALYAPFVLLLIYGGLQPGISLAVAGALALATCSEPPIATSKTIPPP